MKDRLTDRTPLLRASRPARPTSLVVGLNGGAALGARGMHIDGSGDGGNHFNVLGGSNYTVDRILLICDVGFDQIGDW